MTHPARTRQGFTLIELLVAMALMTILTGSVVFIFINAQTIFNTVDAQVQVYQYARYAFDQMERDLANVVRTSDMEFFDDLPPPTGLKGRYDPGEEIPIRGAEDDDSIFNRSFTLRQPNLYTDREGIQRRQDSIYFKTVTVVNGETTAALVEYALTDRDQERPKMIKRLWRVTGVDAANPLRPRFEINGAPGDQADPLVSDLCLYAIESEFELLLRHRRYPNQIADYYTAAQMITPPTRPGLPNGDAFEPFRNIDTATQNMLAVECYVDDRHDPNSFQPDLGEFDPNENGLFRTERRYTFPFLQEGDRVFLYGGGIQAKDYTVSAFVRPDGTEWVPPNNAGPGDLPVDLRVQFEENIEWPAAQAGQVLKVRWRTSFLPPALRVTLKIKDAGSREIRTVHRVFKILSASGG